MAPIPRVALECRLNDRAPRLDLQQGVSRDGGEPALLRDFFAASPAAVAAGAGARLRRFCTDWADPETVVHRGVAEVFLEYDLGTAAEPRPTPSVFFSLPDADAGAVADAALALLFPTPAMPALAANIARCFAACPPGAHIAYMGAMLGRTAEGVRVNVKQLALDDLGAFLEAAGWTGLRRDAEQWAEWAYDRVDRVTVCLDVGPAIAPHLGLECFPGTQPPGEPRWEALLEELCDAGGCLPQNAAALLGVPGALRPPDTRADWPAAWIAATLGAATGDFTTTERRLSHLKLTVGAPAVSVKGYWGAGHVWRRLRPDEDAAAAPSSGGTGPAPLPDVGAAVDRAIAFVVARQAHTGRWSDFMLPAGPSDEWVTAFVAACVLQARPDAGRAAAQRAWDALLRRRRDEPGWGYNRLTPADADSTAWALRLAAGLGVTGSSRIAAAQRFLARHLLADGGVTTYAARDPIRRYARLPGTASLAGWQAAHTCVTAAAAPLLGATAGEYLTRNQAADGCWQSYWWWDDEYATALAVEASAAGAPLAVRWAQARVTASGAVLGSDGRASPWATGWCVRLLRLGTTADAAQASARAERWLLEAQRADGSWRASARLRVPMPGQVGAAEPGTTIDALDQERVFTTAAVATALAGRR